ncbi:MAG: DUF5723 family protein [Ignavibacteriaceae bacterium]
MKNIIIVFALIVISTVPSFAQFGSVGVTDARRMSLGNTSNAISKGVFSIGINPANILNSDESVNFSTVLPIPSISFNGGTNFITINDINYFFGSVNGQGRVLTPDDEQRLNSLFSGGGLVLANSTINLFSIGIKISPTIGAIGLSINDVMEGDITVPQALSEFALNGNTPGSTFNFNDTKANMWWLRDYSFTYAREVPGILQNIFTKMSAGFTLKMVQGFAFAQTQQINTSIQTGSQNQITVNSNSSFISSFSDNFGVKYSFDSASTKTGNMSAFPTPAGNGFGIDLGLSASIEDTWRFAIAVTDIGTINWNNIITTSSTGQYSVNDLLDKTQRDSIKYKFKGISDSSGSLSTSLPTALRLGASYKFNFGVNSWPGTLLLALDINKGFNDMPGNSQKTRVSLGAEWKPMDWIPFIRTGISIGGLTGFQWGLGIGIDAGTLEFNLSGGTQSLFSPNSAKFFSVAFNSRWKF